MTVLLKAALSGQHCLSSASTPETKFPYPITLTLLSNVWTAVFINIVVVVRDWWVKQVEARAVSRASLLEASPAPSPGPFGRLPGLPAAVAPRRDWQSLVAMGLMLGLSMPAKNEALLMLSVSTRTMVFATNVLITMGIATVTGTETFSVPKILAGCLVCLGGVLQGISHMQASAAMPAGAAAQDHPMGYVLALAALVLDGSRWVLLQKVFRENKQADKATPLGYMPPSMGSPPSHQHVQFVLSAQTRFSAMSRRSQARAGGGAAVSKLRMVSAVMWSSSPVMLTLSLLMEPGAAAEALSRARALAVLIAELAVSALGINICEFGVVQRTSAVTFTILSNLHSIPMLVSGIVCFEDEVRLLQLAGFGVCILGSLLYSTAKHAEGRRESRPQR